MAFKSPVFKKIISEHNSGFQNWNAQLGRNEFIPDGNKTKTEIKEKE